MTSRVGKNNINICFKLSGCFKHNPHKSLSSIVRHCHFVHTIARQYSDLHILTLSRATLIAHQVYSAQCKSSPRPQTMRVPKVSIAENPAPNPMAQFPFVLHIIRVHSISTVVRMYVCNWWCVREDMFCRRVLVWCIDWSYDDAKSIFPVCSHLHLASMCCARALAVFKFKSTQFAARFVLSIGFAEQQGETII